jgi:Domain of unknown function (DUF222)
MTESVIDARLVDHGVRADESVTALLAADLTRCAEAELLDAWRGLEKLRNRLAAVEHRFVTEVQRRGLPFEHGARNDAAFVRGLLRVHPREAMGRVRAAEAAGQQRMLTGETVPAPFEYVADAQRSGVISPRHAQVIVAAVDKLPPTVQVEQGAQVEQDLVAYACEFDPHELGRIAARVTALLDQDGALADVDYRQRHRDFTVCQRPDGSATISGEATAELAERLLAVLDSQAAPAPAADGEPDPRKPGQRRHDGLLAALDLVQRAELLPSVGGVSSTVLLSTTEQEWNSGSGVATTGHGAVLPIGEAVRIAGGDARVLTVRFDSSGAVTGRTDARRLFTESQRLVMIARDGGCTFPGCDAPPAWCQAHHVDDHARGGPTTVDNGALVCAHDHRERIRQGWRTVMIDHRPAWIPPPWIDPQQRPRTNPLREMR